MGKWLKLAHLRNYRLSFLSYKISNELESVLFRKLKQLCFLLTTKFAVKKIAENMGGKQMGIENLKFFFSMSDKVESTIGANSHGFKI